MNVRTWRAMLETVGKFYKSKVVNYKERSLARVSLDESGAGSITVCNTSAMDPKEATVTADGYKKRGAQSVCLDPRGLTATLKKLPLDADVEASIDGVALNIVVPDAHYSGQFAGRAPDDFEVIDTFARMPLVCRFTTDHLRSLQYVAKATSTDETRPTLTGVRLEVMPDGMLVAAATDTHRLAFVEVTKGAKPQEKPILLSALWLKPLLALGIAKADGDLRLWMNKGGTVARAIYKTEWGEARFATRIIEGTFPDYSKVIPDAAPLTCTVDTESLKSALETIKPAWKEDANRIDCCTDGDGMLKLSADSPDHGKAEILVEAEFTGDAPFQIKLNAAYVLGGLWGKSETVIGVQEPKKVGGRMANLNPATISSEGHMSVVMPMQK